MKTVPYPDFKTDEEYDEFWNNVSSADCREHAESVLEQVDKELEQFGLEIHMYDFNGDSYVWTIAEREEGDAGVSS